MLQNSSNTTTIQPKVVVIRRRPNQGFGFTLRHFIAYPPEDDPSWPQEASDPYQVKAMETIFIKEVQANGPAHYANLQTGDRVLMVNNTPIAGITYSTIVSMIKQTPSVLTLHVVPKECDVLQMHYTSIAHTPESNRLAAIQTKSIPSPVTVGNGNAGAGALIPISAAAANNQTAVAKSYPQQQQQPQQLISYPLGKSSRSSSITSTASSNNYRVGAGAAGGNSIGDFGDMAQGGVQQHHLLMRGDGGGYVRSQPPPNLTVLSRQQQQQQQQQYHQQQLQQQHQQNTSFYTTSVAGAADNSDLMIRLRESIKQKEEFLKSPLPHAAQQQQYQQQQQQQQHQHFFPHTPPSGSPQLSSSAGSSVFSSTGVSVVGGGGARGQVRSSSVGNTLVKQPLSATSSAASSTRELLSAAAPIASCDMQQQQQQHYYTKNIPPVSSFAPVDSGTMNRGTNGGGAAGAGNSNSVGGVGLHGEIVKTTTFTSVARSQRQQGANGGSVVNPTNVAGMRDKYSKDLDYLETLQETGVTNKVFERKLVSHMNKGFDPFKPLSINTNAIVESPAVPGNVVMMKKPGVLYDSLQHHPLLNQLQMQQQHSSQQQQQLPKVHHPNSGSSSGTNNISSVVDGAQNSRMEIHKASLATATIDHQTPSKYSANKLAEVDEKAATTTTTLTDIAENNDDMPPKVIKAASSDAVIRRFRPMSSFDDNKPMRRISYLRATNNENDYHSDASSITAAAGTASPFSAAAAAAPVIIEHAIKQESDEDPTYDVVAGDEQPEEIVVETVVHAEDVPARGSGGEAAVATTATNTLSALNESSRRSSVNGEMRNSIHIDYYADLNGRFETKDVATEMEVFETEMEIKSSCINGKRLSEYRSWRQVKIEIKGDILKIYPSRNSKSDNNVIELDIRNFKIFDESDKKKYIFRMQSKPTHLATLGNELNLDDVPDKLTSSGSSASTILTTTGTMDHQQQQQPTEILFKTKSTTEMKRIFGLLQWKNSLIYDDCDLQGKQLAEPQKTAATASMPTATYCDDNVQHQQHQLQPEYSPFNTASRCAGELEISDSISPVMKTRKSASHKNIPDKDLGSPKAKNWKDLLFRRGGGSHNADISPSNLASTSKTIGSIGVPLKACPVSKYNEFVPHIVDVCTTIVETKGLSIVGIYRIPGNKAAISELSEQVNKPDFSWDRCNTDVRWEDVNVVSSLLKLFIRSLPDALLPCSFYINFIEADKKTGLVRLRELKELMESLPRHSYETMKHLIRHLSRVSKNCDVNLMEPKNLAIIFGPSIIRTPNDTLEIAVKDMKHQCRIVELLVTQYDYFFENGMIPNIADVSGNGPITSTSSSNSGGVVTQSQEDQTNMLLHNVSKIERFAEREATRTSRFIPQLRRRTHSKRSAVSSDTYSGESVLSLDYSKSSSALTASNSSTNATTASSSSSSSTHAASTTMSQTTMTTKKKERGFISHGSRSAVLHHHRKASLDEKESCGSGSGSAGSMGKEQQRSSVDISILLTDDESSNSRSDTGSMSLTTITDTLDTKLRNLRSGSESNDENGSPEFPKNRRHTFGQPLHLHSENIPYADESPERHFHAHPLDAPNTLMLSKSCTATNMLGIKNSSEKEKEQQKQQQQQRPSLPLPSTVMSAAMAAYKNNKLQHSATAPIQSSAIVGSGIASPPSAASTPTVASVTMKNATTAASGTAVGPSVGGGSARNSYTAKNLRFSSSVYEQCCSEDDSEGSTTSDPKESLVITSPSFFLDRYNKKRRDHRLFRSASFNCRNYSSRHGGSGGGGGGAGTGAGTGAGNVVNSSNALTKDEKTDMNLTKKRQIQNKQNRSIKRRHTVGGPHDYAANTTKTTTTTTTTAGGAVGAATGGGGNCNNHHCKSNGAGGVGNGGTGGGGGSTTTTTTTVLRRIPIPSANGNITNNNNNNNNNSSSGGGTQSNDGGSSSSSSNNGNGSVGVGVGGGGGGATVAVAAGAGGEHVLEVGIRIKNINRSRY